MIADAYGVEQLRDKASLTGYGKGRTCSSTRNPPRTSLGASRSA